MNNSALASEYMLRAARCMKEAKTNYEEGDLVGTILRVGEAVDFSAKVVLALYGIFVGRDWGTFALEYLVSKGKGEGIASLIPDMEEITQKFFMVRQLDESSLKAPTVMARDVEVKALLDKASKIVEAVERTFDDFHS